MEKFNQRLVFGLRKNERSTSKSGECPFIPSVSEKELVNRYLTNSYSEDDLSQMIKLLGQAAGSDRLKPFFFEHWTQLDSQADDHRLDFDAILDKIHHQVNQEESARLLATSGNNPVGFRRRQQLYARLRNIAALLLLPVMALTAYFALNRTGIDSVVTNGQPVFYEVMASVDAITRVSLQDGSEVWLNRGSRLRYPARFDNENRNVYLTGEGYFAVAHNPEKPFVVHTGEIRVVARGTEFNVMAYPEDNTVETSLASGTVDLYRDTDTAGEKILLTLKPSEMAVFQKAARKMSVSRIPDDRYYAWKDGKLVFDNEPMDLVVRKLSRWFNVEMEIRDQSLLDLSFTATFTGESLTQVLELMALASPVRYSVTSRKEIGEGEFSKRKVILRKSAN